MKDKSLVRPTLLVLTSTYPRWRDDPEPAFVHELAKRLTGEFRVIVLGPHARGARLREVLDGVEVVRYRYAPDKLETLVNDGGVVTNLRRSAWKLLLVPSFVLLQAWSAFRLLRMNRVDVIHAHWLIPQGVIAAIMQWFGAAKVPFVVTSHGADLYALNGRINNGIKRFVTSRAGAVTVVSTAMRDRLHALGVDPGKVSVLPMGVDLQGRFTPDPSRPRSDREVLFVGRLVEKKGLCYLLQAMPLVLQRFPDVRLTICGFGPNESALKAQVQRLGLMSAVTFTGAVPQAELPAMYRRAAIFVAPFVQAKSGDQEGLPIALMEAVVCGCPVIAGDVPGIGDLLGDMKPEVCVDARDVKALASKIIAALEEPERAAMVARRVHEKAADHVDWTRIASDYERLLKSKA